MKQTRIHRAWLVFGGMCLYYFVAYGLIYSGFGLFLPSMSQDLGIPYVQLSITSTVRVLSGMITTALVGKIFAKVRLRQFLTLVLLILVGSIFLVSLSSKMWQFLPVFAIMGLCCGLTLYGVVPIILNQWFENPGTLITIASACGGAGGIVLCPLLSQVIHTWGWRMGYRFMALLVLLVMVPITLFLFDFSPVSRGCRPLANQGKKAARPSQSLLAQQGAKTPPAAFILMGAFFLIGALAGGMYIHISSALSSKGFDPLLVSVLVSCFQAGTTLTQIVPGMLSVRFGPRMIISLTFPLVAAGSIALILLMPDSPLFLVMLAVILLGGGRMFTAVNPLVARYAFGQEGFHKAYPKLQAIYLIGTAFTSIIYGSIYDATGSYDGSLWLIAGCMAALFVITQLIFILVDRSHRRIGGQNNAV